jgi:CRISPR-associated exonuclease Cas4
MEQTSELVAEGRLIDETSYMTRAGKYTEVEIDGARIDYFDPARKVVHEIKKSGSMEEAHRAQVQYYLYKLDQSGIAGVTGLIEYPKLKQRVTVESLNDDEREKIRGWEGEVDAVTGESECPDVIRAKICRSCSYFDFCYATEFEAVPA